MKTTIKVLSTIIFAGSTLSASAIDWSGEPRFACMINGKDTVVVLRHIDMMSYNNAILTAAGVYLSGNVETNELTIGDYSGDSVIEATGSADKSVSLSVGIHGNLSVSCRPEK